MVEDPGTDFLGFQIICFFVEPMEGRMFFFLTTSTKNPMSWLHLFFTRFCRRVSDHLLEGSDLARLCGLFLPVAKVPSTARVAEVCQMGCVRSLGFGGVLGLNL